MNAFVRQASVLSVLWALCEMLLPDGKTQQMVRMTASLMIMTALLSTISGWLHQAQPEALTAMTAQVQQISQESYHRTALTALANQLESFCVNTARRAGYAAEAAVYLSLDGALHHVDLVLVQQKALLSPDELAAALAGQLGAEKSSIRLVLEEE